MKSKKVNDFINNHLIIGLLQFTAADIEYCVNMAEQEIREAAPVAECPVVNLDVLNYRVAAVEAFRQACPYRRDTICLLLFESLDRDRDGCIDDCHAGCEYAKRFTHCLGELIRKTNG